MRSTWPARPARHHEKTTAVSFPRKSDLLPWLLSASGPQGAEPGALPLRRRSQDTGIVADGTSADSMDSMDSMDSAHVLT